jgi:hypothetical protein
MLTYAWWGSKVQRGRVAVRVKPAGGVIEILTTAVAVFRSQAENRGGGGKHRMLNIFNKFGVFEKFSKLSNGGGCSGVNGTNSTGQDNQKSRCRCASIPVC